MNTLFETQEQKKAIVKFLNYYLIDFLKWAKKNKFDLNDTSLTIPELYLFTENWLEEESKIMKEILDKSEDREKENEL